MNELTLLPRGECRFDLVSLGKIMLRLDPEQRRIHTTRHFAVSEGGGEYNVAHGLRRCFGLRTAIVSSLVDNAIGRLVEDVMLQGGVDLSYLHWLASHGTGHGARNGPNFTERGFGPRAPLGCSDRCHTALAQLKVDDIDWEHLFGRRHAGTRWLHTGGVFTALSPHAPLVAKAAMDCARRPGAVVSYDPNYRPSLWTEREGLESAQRINTSLMPHVDVLFGNEEDFSAALGFPVHGVDANYRELPIDAFKHMIRAVLDAFPNISTVATTLRTAHSATNGGSGAICYHRGEFHSVADRDVQIFDRVGGGDSFASGFIFGLLCGHSDEWALRCGHAHGALAMSAPSDTSVARQHEVAAAMDGQAARIDR